MAKPSKNGTFDGQIERTVGFTSGKDGTTTYVFYKWNGKEWEYYRDRNRQKLWEQQQSEEGARNAADLSGNSNLKFNLNNKKNLVNSGSLDALRYPKDESLSNISDYVSFSFFKYKPPLQGTNTSNDGIDTDGTGFDIENAYRNYNASVVEIEPDDDLKSILLYMPQDIQSEYSQDWGPIKIGTAAAVAIRTFTGNPDIASIGSTVREGLEKAAFSAITGLTNKFAGGELNRDQVLGLVTDQIANPNTENLFTGSNLRKFTLNFKMVADSAPESVEILKICNTFKSASMPSFGGKRGYGVSEGAGQFLTIPNVVNVSFMSGNSLNKFLPQYKTCAITSVNINFTADGTYATYENGAPVAVELSVSFSELKPLFANEIDITGESASF
jgi:hypothetical protein